MEIKIVTNDFEVISSGSIIIPENKYVEFQIENLKFRIVFAEERDDKGVITNGRIASEVKNSGSDNEFLQITMFNQNDAFFSSMKEMLNLATLDGKSIQLKFCIQSINRTGQEAGDKLLFYTWFKSN